MRCHPEDRAYIVKLGLEDVSDSVERLERKAYVAFSKLRKEWFQRNYDCAFLEVEEFRFDSFVH